MTISCLKLMQRIDDVFVHSLYSCFNDHQLFEADVTHFSARRAVFAHEVSMTISCLKLM